MKLDVEIWFDSSTMMKSPNSPNIENQQTKRFNMVKGERLKRDTISDASSDGNLIDVMASPAGTVGTMWIYQQPIPWAGLEMEFLPQEMAFFLNKMKF